jgi:hypothetical protein
MMQDVERVARAICADDPDIRMGDAEGVVQQRVNVEWKNYTRQATAAISAMSPDTALSHALHAGEDVGYVRGWNAAIEAAKWAVVGYIHPDHGRLPGEAFASAQIDKLKKPTGN